MANLNGFNANEVDPDFTFDPIPAAKYLAIVIESAMKPTKNGNGRYLKLTFQILEGEYKGRKLWAQLNLENPSADAVRIARAELSAICRAVGVMAPKDSVELHNLPLVVKVGHKKRDDNGELTNVINGYEKKNTVAASAPQSSNGPGSTPPWKR